MSRWEDKMRRVNARLVKRFSYDVILHLASGDKSVIGVFDNPFSLSELGDGGRIADSSPELYLKDEDAVGLELRSLVTVVGKQWAIVSPPQPDSTGLTKLILGNYNGEQSKPIIQY
ncbi:head-tail joining protein [Vibrio gangliei]|uniref:head-tail joining protein n=1 Tax=Vibrio gangliei TaxID=2077090 RepID=UPI000D019B2E|nr:head-tail joining protein [Vibrio gangliei]